MATQIADAVLHIDESLDQRQLDLLEDHMRVQQGVISTGHTKDAPHLLIIEYNPARTQPVNFIHMVERHGYHAERVA